MVSERSESRPFDILGISEAEERAYRWLLENPGTTASEIACGVALTVGETESVLDAIEVKSLVTHLPERPRRYLPAAPDVAIEGMILKRQNALRRAQEEVRELKEQSDKARRHGAEQGIVELITSPVAERQLFEHIQNSAMDEMAALVKLPMRVTRPETTADYEPQRAAQARGVRYRSINDAEFMESPGAVARLRDDMKGGEEVRVVPYLPLKMVLADHRIALIPLSLQQGDGPALLVRHSALLEALYDLFELLWAQAVPVSLTKSREVMACSSERQPLVENEGLISLMAAGLNDKGIAGELNISVRTLERRIARLMRGLGTRTRFQAGWQAALHLSGQGSAEHPIETLDEPPLYPRE